VALAPEYSYHYRLLWGTTPRVVLAGDFGVGLNPTVTLAASLTLKPQPGLHAAFPQLVFDLNCLPLQAGDLIDVRSTPFNAHRSFSWWREGRLQAHLGDLQALSGERVGGRVLEVVNEFDLDECLALYQRDWSLRLREGQSGGHGDYHFHLSSLCGLVTGSSYRARGWLGLRQFPTQQLEGWSDSWVVA